MSAVAGPLQGKAYASQVVKEGTEMNSSEKPPADNPTRASPVVVGREPERRSRGAVPGTESEPTEEVNEKLEKTLVDNAVPGE